MPIMQCPWILWLTKDHWVYRQTSKEAPKVIENQEQELSQKTGGIESVECSTGMEWWNGTVEWNGGMERWNGHFNHFLMDGGKGSFRGQYIRVVYNHWTGMMEWNGGME